jgi:hypothetical protein
MFKNYFKTAWRNVNSAFWMADHEQMAAGFRLPHFN